MLNQANIRSPSIQCRRKWINLLRHGSLPLDNDGAIEFLRKKDYVQDLLVFCHRWSDEKLKSSMAGGEETRKDFSIVLILQE